MPSSCLRTPRASATLWACTSGRWGPGRRSLRGCSRRISDCSNAGFSETSRRCRWPQRARPWRRPRAAPSRRPFCVLPRRPPPRRPSPRRRPPRRGGRAALRRRPRALRFFVSCRWRRPRAPLRKSRRLQRATFAKCRPLQRATSKRYALQSRAGSRPPPRLKRPNVRQSHSQSSCAAAAARALASAALAARRARRAPVRAGESRGRGRSS
mmetsp:Transcript_17461/g.60475  ORF Transcript_17461/g.60475 Transcript_17461/m.60475 type:complete len:211 (-) Transcript_17461:296-928(-)